MRYARILVSNLNFAKFIYKCTRLLERFGETIITILRENYLPNRRDTCFLFLLIEAVFSKLFIYLAEVILENEKERFCYFLKLSSL